MLHVILTLLLFNIGHGVLFKESAITRTLVHPENYVDGTEEFVFGNLAATRFARLAPGATNDELGSYLITHSTYVYANASSQSQKLTHVLRGEDVDVEEVIVLTGEDGHERVRARIRSPAGWITLVDHFDDTRWASRTIDAYKAADKDAASTNATFARKVYREIVDNEGHSHYVRDQCQNSIPSIEECIDAAEKLYGDIKSMVLPNPTYEYGCYAVLRGTPCMDQTEQACVIFNPLHGGSGTLSGSVYLCEANSSS